MQRGLSHVGVEPGAIIMVHASMRAVGGQAKDLVKALLNQLGPHGTLMAYVDFEPTAAQPTFDPKTSPAAAGYGVLAEVIRAWPGATRSLNPGASMAAIGAKAQWLCEPHPLDYGYGPGTPLARLVAAEGKVLLLGSDPDQVTMLHYAEHVARLPNKRVVTLPYGTEFDTSEPILAAMPREYFAQITNAFIAAGYARQGQVGGAMATLMPALELVQFAVEKMEREYG